jgi:hypothetical protein
MKSIEADRANLQPFRMTKHSPIRYLKTSPEVIRLAVMMYVRFPLSLHNVEDLLHERGIDVSHEANNSVLVEPLWANIWDSSSCLGPSIIAKQLNSKTV